MPVTPIPELLTEAAGVKIYKTKDWNVIDPVDTGKICITLENVNEVKALGKNYGFHLTKSKWDPYPWINCIDADSLADTAGLRAGDCLINVNGVDLIGLRIKQIASLIYGYQERNLNLFVWRYDHEAEEQKETGIAVKGPLPEVASNLANALSAVVRTLECPICLENSTSPVSQCVHGHIICVECRSRTPRCPICRVRLGQGRCLLADKLHKIFRDTFHKKENLCNSEEYRTPNLRDWLFGKSKKKEVMPGTGKSRSTNLKTRQLLLNKLFRGGLEKAASADNLTTVSDNATSENMLKENGKFIERLNLYDRTKSASTGELSNETVESIRGQLQINASNTPISSTCSSMANVSSTHFWQGSLESVSCIQIVCPFSMQNGCDYIITSDILLEHLKEIHGVPQVHFYSARVKLPVPLPFGSEAVYIIHIGRDLFFFQREHKSIWISSTVGAKTEWKWILQGQGQNGTEIKIQKHVVSLVNPMMVNPVQHTATLPTDLVLDSMDIQLTECRTYDQLEV